MTERADQLHNNNAHAHYTVPMQASLVKDRITQVCQSLYSQDLAPCDFWLYPNLKPPL